MTAITITILDGEQLSDNLNVGQLRFDGNTVLGLRFPSTWPAATGVNIVEAEGNGGTYRPLCDINGDPVVIADPSPNGTFPAGKTIKDSSIPAIFYGLTNIKLYAIVPVIGDQSIEIITDVL